MKVSMRKVIAFTLFGLLVVSGIFGVLLADREICKVNPGDEPATDALGNLIDF